MEYANHLSEYAAAASDAQVAGIVAQLRETAKKYETAEVCKFCFSALDLTTLSCSDSVESVTALAEKTVAFYEKYPHIPNVASICIYPPFVETVGLAVDGTPMRITCVSGGFPSSQTFLEVKMLETAMAVENGADEIDIVLNVGKMLEGHYDEVANEVEVLRGDCSSLMASYQLLSLSDDGNISITMLSEGRSGMMVPASERIPVSGIYATALGSSFDSAHVFMPLSSAGDGIAMKTAIKGADPGSADMLREMGYSCMSWMESESVLYSAFMTEKTMMVVVLSFLFLILLVSMKECVRSFYEARRGEKAELMLLGLGRCRTELAFMLSFMIVLAASLLLVPHQGIHLGFRSPGCLLPADCLHQGKEGGQEGYPGGADWQMRYCGLRPYARAMMPPEAGSPSSMAWTSPSQGGR